MIEYQTTPALRVQEGLGLWPRNVSVSFIAAPFLPQECPDETAEQGVLYVSACGLWELRLGKGNIALPCGAVFNQKWH